jgi:hypothetical protein
VEKRSRVEKRVALDWTAAAQAMLIHSKEIPARRLFFRLSVNVHRRTKRHGDVEVFTLTTNFSQPIVVVSEHLSSPADNRS